MGIASSGKRRQQNRNRSCEESVKSFVLWARLEKSLFLCLVRPGIVERTDEHRSRVRVTRNSNVFFFFFFSFQEQNGGWNQRCVSISRGSRPFDARKPVFQYSVIPTILLETDSISSHLRFMDMRLGRRDFWRDVIKARRGKISKLLPSIFVRLATWFSSFAHGWKVYKEMEVKSF